MKKIFNYTLISGLLLMMGCTNDDNIINQVDNNVVRGAILRTIEAGPLNFDLRNLDQAWPLSLEMEDNNNGALLDQVEVHVTFFDNTPENGNNPVNKSLVKILPASAFETGPNGLPRTSLEVSLPEVVEATGLSEDQYTGGDVFRIELELVLTDGRVYTKDDVNGGIAGGSFFRSPFQYRLTIVGCPPRPGDYIIEMTDDFGDGWQTTNADDGPGIQVFGDGELLGEFGICTSYTTAQDEWCTGSGSSATATLTIPDGVQEAEWIFPGDFWGEIGFQIFGPEGQLIYSAAPGSQQAGEFFVVLCNFE